MIRFYLVPVVVTADGSRVPKYFGRGDPARLFRVNTEVMDYGNEPSMVVVADLDDAQDATLAGQTDVTKFSDNLDTQLGGRLAAMQSALEALNLPAQMVTATTTDRQVLRGIIGVFMVAQCMQGKGFRIFNAGITLATTLNSLPVAARQALQNCATTLGYDQTGITLASTVRDILTKIVQQASPRAMMGVTI